jgi:hypothetical protein
MKISCLVSIYYVTEHSFLYFHRYLSDVDDAVSKYAYEAVQRGVRELVPADLSVIPIQCAKGQGIPRTLRTSLYGFVGVTRFLFE